MPDFDAQFAHWPTLDAFVQYLGTIPRPAWCHGATVHNTYIPNEYQWRGLASMQSMRATYIGKGWSAGPHLYLAAEAPDPADRGIWQMTPLTHPGVHAGPCNASRIGIENVADWNARPPSPAQRDLLRGVLLALLRLWGLPPDAVNVHNECMPGRTCPGRYLTGAALRADLAQPAPAPPAWRKYRIREATTVLTARAGDAPLAPGPCRLAPGQIVNVGDVTNGWLWVSDRETTAPGIGFILAAYAEAL